MDGKVIAVSCSGVHHFSKQNQERIRLIAGLGVEDDAHMGTTVKHRSRVAQDLRSRTYARSISSTPNCLMSSNCQVFALLPDSWERTLLPAGSSCLRFPQTAGCILETQQSSKSQDFVIPVSRSIGLNPVCWRTWSAAMNMAG